MKTQQNKAISQDAAETGLATLRPEDMPTPAQRRKWADDYRKAQDGALKFVDFRNLLTVVMGTVSNQTGESFDKAILRSQSADEIWRRHKELQAHADKLAEALKAMHACHRAFSSNDNWTALDDDAREAAEAALEAYEAAQ